MSYLFDKEEYERGDAIAINFHIDDVKDLDESLTDEEARQVLSRFDSHHEGSDEALWEDLKLHIDMFKEKQQEEEDE